MEIGDILSPSIYSCSTGAHTIYSEVSDPSLKYPRTTTIVPLPLMGGASTNALQVSLSDFLYKWLKLHVLGIDRKFEDFVMKSSSK